MVDQFTKWVECIPLPSQTAEVTARGAINEFFSRFGYPFEIFTDQRRNFESELFQGVCKLLHIHKARTTSYRPSASGQVERYNRTFVDAVRCYTDGSQTRWDENLAQLAGILCFAVNRHTGYTPSHLMLGREIYQPADLIFRPPAGDQPAHVDEYVANVELFVNVSVLRIILSSLFLYKMENNDERLCMGRWEGDAVAHPPSPEEEPSTEERPLLEE
ncbi:uncharacterized protein LOC121378026 [Gigantopelta aegis]|uniref:uncharacterized protein LOC121378026 n=1 Tax=Gigantopelta aegis TaxID=1735272 RepID=UPI001B8878F2|nr:uncharacterized protein LOC121378026 [Gigantopelta aegis]